jgi:tRNA threonylcarbamoyladenosine biosynthesis protein TsaB
VILALDTSHMKGSVAVTREGEILCEILFDASDTHSATLMPAVDACLKGAKAVIRDIDLFAVVSGPGSFTGLRIGLSTVKAFASVRKRPVAAIPSLEVLAAAFPFARLKTLPLIDARRGEVYGALYSTDGGSPEVLVPPFSVRPEGLIRLIEDASESEPVIACGTGAERYRRQLESLLPSQSAFAGSRWSVPSASILAALARGRTATPYGELPALEPLYIRPPDARLPAGYDLKPGGGG